MQILRCEDLELEKNIIDSIKECDGHCPCAIEHNRDTLCMCKEFRDQIARDEEGPCNCGLYIAKK